MTASEERRSLVSGDPISIPLASASAIPLVTTGLPARQRLSVELARAVADGQRLATFVIKVSDLGQINHSRGYGAGDEVIRELVRRIDTSHCQARFGGRLGGGHFMATACTSGPHEDSTEYFVNIINTLIDGITQPIHLSDGPVYVSCRIGASVAPTDTSLSDELLCNAELALRSALFASYAFYLPGLREEVYDRMTLRSALAGAMERDEFHLAYQPQVCQQSGRVFGAEALLRWQSKSLGSVSPARFIPVAEAAGLMPELGNWVLIHACRQARAWLDAGTPLRVSVNACAAQLETGDFLERVEDALFQSRLPANLLEVEVTESMLIRQVDENRNTLSAIRKLGVKLGLDDFGTGYSSLAYLRNFTFDTLKIDRLFVSGLTEENRTDVLVRAIIAIGHELGNEVIAEGIETEGQKSALMALGCTRMQGFLFGRPVPASELEKLLVPEAIDG
ncbi:putative bifunctional diguanylate cyclase/phosphodiesterase [Marinobacter halotolerans]|uniref:putative bifunctional diguanylate cyclase/phosphodiesterase n=1 Tax=Marinobacter halotolerans TaxID=1569211 RepID=UPI001247C648|nr:GGDEF domain-containing phosphodiesterase [Marinobacter halotolerans]